MKKCVFKLICLVFAFIIFLASCNASLLKKQSVTFNIDEQEYVLKIEIYDNFCQFIFLLTPDNKLFSQYKDVNKNFEQAINELEKLHISYIELYLNDVLSQTKKEDVEDYVQLSDFQTVNLHFSDKHFSFSYGASKSSSVNALVEIIIGCSNFKEAEKELSLLKPAFEIYRELLLDYTKVKTLEEEKNESKTNR